MKYAFMSFSCEDADLNQMLDLARLYGYEGIEPRTGGIHKHGVELDLSADGRKRALDLANEKGVAFACIAVGARFADPVFTEAGLIEAEAGIRLAHDLDCGIIRVFGGRLADDQRNAAIDRMAASLRRLAPIAADHDVTVCFETHDDWCDPAHVVAVMQAVDHPAIGVNWDVMHPVRNHLATMEESYRQLAPWIKHVHIHDGMADPVNLAFRAFGEGEYDLETVFRSLRADGYDGYLSGEWINWEPAEVHLPREINRMRTFEADLSETPS
jgi:sugar phosphate isomerase/epimerase